MLVFAHALVKRGDLPVPEWLFGWAATVVLIGSFVLLSRRWPRARLEQGLWRPLPRGEVIGSRAIEIACGTIGVGLLALTVWAGLAGTADAERNFAPTFVFIVVWVGFVLVSVLFGDVFRAFSPWRALGRLIERVAPPPARGYPERLGRWPAAAGLLVFTWIELVSEWPGDPRAVALLVIAYTVLTLAAQAVYGVDAWTRNGEAFAVYFNLFSRLSVFEVRDGVAGRRRVLGGLPKLDPRPGTVAMVVVMIGTVTYDGISSGPLWRRHVGAWLTDAGGELFAGTVGLLLGAGLIAGFYHLGMLGARSVGGRHGVARLRRAFVHSLVPIAMVYAVAHYLSYLIFEGQSIVPLVSDPLGRGWDVLGSAAYEVDRAPLSPQAVWYLQVSFVLAGHVAALVLAHDRALVLYGQVRQAVRSQYWMLGVMIGFTTLALWLLEQANA